MKQRIVALMVGAVLVWGHLALGADESPQTLLGTEPAVQEPAEGISKTQDQPNDQPKEKTFLLRYKFHEGQMLRWKVEHLVTIETTIQGTTQKAETGSRSTKAWRVVSVDSDGQAVFAHLVEDVDMWQKVTARQEVRYNSKTDDKAPPEYQNAAASVGVPLSTITLSAIGKVIERNDRRGMPETESKYVTMPLMEAPVKMNDRWDTPYIIPVRKPDGTLINIQARQVFQLKKVVAGLATISLNTEVLTPVHDPRVQAQLVQRLLNGTIKFDIVAGRVEQQQMDLDESVLAFSGAESSMDYKARFREEFLSAETMAGAGETATKISARDNRPRNSLQTARGRRVSPKIRR